MSVCGWVHICNACACGGQRSKSSLPGLLPILSFETRSLTEPGDSPIFYTGWGELPESSCFSPSTLSPKTGHIIMSNLYLCAWDLSLSPYVCADSIFSTEPSFQPFIWKFSIYPMKIKHHRRLFTRQFLRCRKYNGVQSSSCKDTTKIQPQMLPPSYLRLEHWSRKWMEWAKI